MTIGYRQLGASGLKLSQLSLGSWVTFGNQVDCDMAYDLMTYAYDQGINFFDNAEVYAQGESERLMGAVLKKTGWGRDTFCVSSKVFWGGDKPTQRGLSRKHIHDACHGALNRLGVDYLDLYFCHRPDPDTPIRETVMAMNDLIVQGKVLYWGTSEWRPNHLIEAHKLAQKYGWHAPIMEQPEYNLMNRSNMEVQLKPVLATYGMGTTTWSPLCSGFLSGKYQHGIPKGARFGLPDYTWLADRYYSDQGRLRIQQVDQLKAIIEPLAEFTMAQIAIAWCLLNPQVSTVILGASNRAQLQENVASVGAIAALTPDIQAALNRVFPCNPHSC
jgi:voltage-dependent potassium channel beta subunit